MLLRQGMMFRALGTASVLFPSTAAFAADEQLLPHRCEAPVAEVLGQLIGEWSLSIEADEGWTGYGTSTITWDGSRECSIIETQLAVFNQESATPFQNTSTTVITYDRLSESFKVLTSDRRGYTHLGFSSGSTANDLLFEIGSFEMKPRTRRIAYRNVSAESMEWSWQGRAQENDAWHDRLNMTYQRK